MQDLRYPIGKCPSKPVLTPDERRDAIEAIAETPDRLKAAIAGLSPDQLDTPYRPGGWTVRQLVHHLPDSHMNSYVRFKLALTEDEPTIKPYDEALWAKLSDSQETPIEVSMTLLDALHKRWITLLRGNAPRGFCATAQASRARHDDAGRRADDLLLAREASRCAHHFLAPSHELGPLTYLTLGQTT